MRAKVQERKEGGIRRCGLACWLFAFVFSLLSRAFVAYQYNLQFLPTHPHLFYMDHLRCRFLYVTLKSSTPGSHLEQGGVDQSMERSSGSTLNLRE